MSRIALPAVRTGIAFRRLFLLASSTLLIGSTLVPAAMAQSQEEVDQAEAERALALEEYIRVQDEVDAALEEYEDIRGEIFDVEYRMDRLENRIGEDAEAASAIEETAKELAVEAYITGSLGSFSVALEAKNIQDIVTSQALFEKANAISLASLDRLDAVSRELKRLTSEFEDDRTYLGELEGEATLAIQRIEIIQQVALEWFEREDEEAHAAKHAWDEELARRRAAEAARRAREAARRAREGPQPTTRSTATYGVRKPTRIGSVTTGATLARAAGRTRAPTYSDRRAARSMPSSPGPSANAPVALAGMPGGYTEMTATPITLRTWTAGRTGSRRDPGSRRAPSSPTSGTRATPPAEPITRISSCTREAAGRSTRIPPSRTSVSRGAGRRTIQLSESKMAGSASGSRTIPVPLP